MERTWSDLYRHIREQIVLAETPLPADILERFLSVSRIAIEWYLVNPSMLGLLVRIARLPRDELALKAQAVFETHFAEVFSGLDVSRLGHPLEQLIDLIQWLLAKTRKGRTHGNGGGTFARRSAPRLSRRVGLLLFGVGQRDLSSAKVRQHTVGEKILKTTDSPVGHFMRGRHVGIGGIGEWVWHSC